MINPHLISKHFRNLVYKELRKRGFDVYLPLIDKRVAYCAIRNNDGSYLDIVVKGRRPRWIFAFGHFKSRKNLFVILYPPDDNFYIVPSLEIEKWLNGSDKMYISKAIKEELDAKYKNNFDLLANYK
jgi:hypothetical protein